MTYEQITYRRDTLYEQIWQRPVREVAKDYGVSDVALAKVCRKLRIPRPPVGYWVRRAAGYDDPIPPLPALKPGEQAEYTAERPTVLRRGVPADIKIAEPVIIVADELARPHPLIKVSRELRSATRKDKLLEVPLDGCLDIRTSKTTVDRAFRIFDAVLKALDGRGFKTEVTRAGAEIDQWGPRKTRTASQTRVLIGEDWVRFGIDELYDSVVVQPPPQRSTYNASYVYTPPPTRVRRPNGKLALQIRDAPWSSGYRTTWGDAKTQRLETCLNDFIRGLRTVSMGLREERLERERREQERLEAELRRAEEAERQRRETALAEDLNRRINAWHRAQMIRQFADAVETAAGEQSEAAQPDSDLTRWLEWARRRADRMTRSALRDVNYFSPSTTIRIPHRPWLISASF